MKDLSVFVWCLIGAAVTFGIYAIYAMIAWAVILVLIGLFKPDLFEKLL
jgi:hypothetical protein